jgi:hypothetical protein
MYLNSVDIDVDTSCTIQNYLKLISDRASGRPTQMGPNVNRQIKFGINSA